MKRTKPQVAALPHDAPDIPETTPENLLPEKPEGYSRLVIGRAAGESLTIDCNGVQVIIAVVQINPQRTRLAILAPRDAHILRSELKVDAYGRR
jgi:sRNA-binding carbon storage regulator CsrA